MKHPLLCLAVVTALVFLGGTVSVGQWYPQSSGTTVNLNGVTFTDASNGFVVGDGGTILRTIDGGATWGSQPSGTLFPLKDICFVDASHGWIAGGIDSSIILHTTDGGISWTTQAEIPFGTLYALSFVDRNVGFAAGGYNGWWYYSLLLKTRDGGMTWTQQTDDTISHLTEVDFVDEQTGWVLSCDEGECGQGIYVSTNGGTTWRLQHQDEYPWSVLHDLAFYDAENGFAAGWHSDGWGSSGGQVARTTNGGETWSYTFFGLHEPHVAGFRDVSLLDGNRVVVVGEEEDSIGQVCYWSMDGGTTWSQRSIGTVHDLNRICFIDSLSGWAVGDNGTILHTTNGGVTFIAADQIGHVPTDFSLSQNYPNPFNPTATIKYELPISTDVRLTVYDMLGREVSVLVNERRDAGVHAVKFEASRLSSGVYLYRLQAGDFRETKRLLLLR